MCNQFILIRGIQHRIINVELTFGIMKYFLQVVYIKYKMIMGLESTPEERYKVTWRCQILCHLPYRFDFHYLNVIQSVVSYDMIAFTSIKRLNMYTDQPV